MQKIKRCHDVKKIEKRKRAKHRKLTKIVVKCWCKCPVNWIVRTLCESLQKRIGYMIISSTWRWYDPCPWYFWRWTRERTNYINAEENSPEIGTNGSCSINHRRHLNLELMRHIYVCQGNDLLISLFGRDKNSAKY